MLSWLDGEGQQYTRSCDMWSVGVTAYVLLAGRLPIEMPEADGADLAEHVRTTAPNFSAPLWQEPSMEDARDFIAKA